MTTQTDIRNANRSAWHWFSSGVLFGLLAGTIVIGVIEGWLFG